MSSFCRTYGATLLPAVHRNAKTCQTFQNVASTSNQVIQGPHEHCSANHKEPPALFVER